MPLFNPPVTVQDEGTSQGTADTLNFVGSAVTAAVSGSVATITVTGGGSGITVKDEGGALTTDKTKVNFIGGGVTAVNDGDATQANVTIPMGVHTQRFTLNGKPAVITNVDGAWIAPFAGTIKRITLYRRTAGSGGTLTVDVNKNGTTIYTTQGNRPAVTAAGGNNAINTTTPDVTTFAQDDRFQIDIDTIETGNSLDLTLNLTVEYT